METNVYLIMELWNSGYRIQIKPIAENPTVRHKKRSD